MEDERGGADSASDPRAPEWMRHARRAAGRAESASILFLLNLVLGAFLVVPVTGAMALMWVLGDKGATANVLEILTIWLFVLVFALIAAVTGGLVYLPVVLWAAMRSPHRGRAIALACTPLVALGAVPWGTWPALVLPWVWVPVAAGLLLYGVLVRLPDPG